VACPDPFSRQTGNGGQALRWEIESLPQAVGESDDSKLRFLNMSAAESLAVLQTNCVGLTLALVAV
jgi:hypothetical protein